MTITVDRIERQPLRPSRNDAEGMLGVLHATIGAVSELDPDLLHSHTSAGQAMVTLSGAARAAAAALGAEPGVALRTAPGVVVVRDLVSAVTRLELAASRRAAPLDPSALQQITHRANTAYGQFLLSVPTAA